MCAHSGRYSLNTPKTAHRAGYPRVERCHMSMSTPRLARLALLALVAAAVPSLTLASSDAGTPSTGPAQSVNLAIGASATATSAGSGAPASNAVDGSATTTWCATQWTGSVTVDLGSARALDSIGVTLGATASPSTAAIALATQAGSWQPVASAQNIALNGNTPSYVALPRTQAVRYARLTVTTGDGTPACVGEFRLLGHNGATDHMLLGADLSFMLQEQAAGTQFTDAGVAASPLQILRSHGANYVRMRLWLHPPAGYSDLASDLTLARQVKAAGMKVYLDIHYSDFWADPQHQDTPAAWQGQALAPLTNIVRSYTHDVIAAFAAQGTPVDMVSIGNEIRNGMLWPVGQIDWTANTGWDNLATLLKAGVAGARSANPAHHKQLVMLHYDQGGNNPQATTFFDNLATRFGKDIIIAEMQSAWTLANGDTTGNFVWQASQLEPGYPASAGGQLSLVNDILSILAQAPGGHGAGFFYWEPEWVPGVGWTPGAGAPNDNLTLFDFQGRALPSIGLFENPTTVCQRYDRYDVPCVIPS